MVWQWEGLKVFLEWRAWHWREEKERTVRLRDLKVRPYRDYQDFDVGSA
jgi:hypothetical protein